MRRKHGNQNSKASFAYLPRPDLVVGALSDLGLSDVQIGRYFGVDEGDIAAIPHVTLHTPGSLDMSDVLCRPKRLRHAGTAEFAIAGQR
jgi:hypothetical protein